MQLLWASGVRKEFYFKSIFFFKSTYFFGCRAESFCLCRLKMCKTVQATRQAGRNPVGVVQESSSSQGALALNGPHRFSQDGNGGAHTAKSCTDSNEMERLFSGPSHFSYPPDTTHTVSLGENAYIYRHVDCMVVVLLREQLYEYMKKWDGKICILKGIKQNHN